MYLAPQNMPSAFVLTSGNKVVLYTYLHTLYCTGRCDPQEFARSAITVSTLCCTVLNIVTAGVCLFSDEGVDTVLYWTLWLLGDAGVDTVLKVVAAGVCQVSDNGVDIVLYWTLWLQAFAYSAMMVSTLYCNESWDCWSLPTQRWRCEHCIVSYCS